MDGLANDMGLFLQKTNIIRDYLEDIVEEPQPRMFWPKEIWGQYAKSLDEFKDPQNRCPSQARCIHSTPHLNAAAGTPEGCASAVAIMFVLYAALCTRQTLVAPASALVDRHVGSGQACMSVGLAGLRRFCA
jgi:phytoene/squalene synthetase